ncbi:MFS transporter [Patulibacter sp. SYSU D01012]|uniref:MFS transporter n=1 Tax=Patulibacter sp. SYSU D01012 TaxID=2817381 RepID=UPI001B311C5C|nr:MFS transporter [Patulibacter sp. SYSU D01012]
MSSDAAPPRRTLAFVVVAAAFAVTMLGTTLPAPLYGLYREAFGFSAFLVTVIFAVYAGGVIAALLLFGHLSDQVGRKPILLGGLAFSAASAVVFLLAQSTGPLFVGRVLSGLSAGIFTGSATATLLELSPPQHRARGALVATFVNMVGLGAGPLVAGALSEAFGAPLRVTYAVDLALVVLLVVALAVLPEPGRRAERPRLRPQRPGVPAEVRGVFVPAAMGAFAGFAVFGLFTSVAPSVMTQLLGVHHRVIVGLVIFGVFLFSAVGQVALALVPSHLSQRAGVLLLAAGIALIGTSVAATSLPLLVVGGLISGIGQGLSFRAGLTAVTLAAPAARRGEVVSTYFVIAYVAISLPVVGVGVLTVLTDLQAAGEIFSAIIVALALTTFALLVRRARLGADAPAAA